MKQYKNPVRICGCKLVELPYLRKHLVDQSTLVVGERRGDEGIIGAVREVVKEGNIICTDMDPVEPGSIVSNLVDEFWIDYVQEDFTKFPDDIAREGLCNQIVCINVLEHFGMGWGDKSAILDWDKDLDGLNKMMDLMGDSPTARTIITVPAGPPIFYGDCLPSGLPFLRRYDKQRMIIIRNLVASRGFKVTNEEFFFSPDLINWTSKDINEDTINIGYAQYQLASPNFIWGFIIVH